MMLVPVLVPTTFDQTYASYLRVAALGLTILLPVVAILMLTGEWSQRSVMTTFTQEPRRIRVLNAKLAVSMVLGCGAAVFGGVVTAAGLGLAATSGRALDADLTVGAITGYLLFVLLNVLAGVALGALLQSSATAIAASFALPAAFAVLGTASTLVSEWIDMSTTWNWVLESDWAGPTLPVLLARIHGVVDHARSIIVGTVPELALVAQVLQFGLRGCIPAERVQDDLMRALSLVMRGEIWLPRHEMTRLVDLAGYLMA